MERISVEKETEKLFSFVAAVSQRGIRLEFFNLMTFSEEQPFPPETPDEYLLRDQS